MDPAKNILGYVTRPDPITGKPRQYPVPFLCRQCSEPACYSDAPMSFYCSRCWQASGLWKKRHT